MIDKYRFDNVSRLFKGLDTIEKIRSWYESVRRKQIKEMTITIKTAKHNEVDSSSVVIDSGLCHHLIYAIEHKLNQVEKVTMDALQGWELIPAPPIPQKNQSE